MKKLEYKRVGIGDVGAHPCARPELSKINKTIKGRHMGLPLHNVIRKIGMKEHGIVKEINKDKIIIEISPSAACSKCCSCNKSKQRNVSVENKDQNVHIGEKIEYEVETKNMVMVFLMMYGTPLIAFLFGLFFTFHLTKNPSISFLAGLCAVSITYFTIGAFLKKHPSFVPKTCINRL